MRQCTGRTHGMAQEAGYMPGTQPPQTLALQAVVCKGHLPRCSQDPAQARADIEVILSPVTAPIQGIILDYLTGGWKSRGPTILANCLEGPEDELLMCLSKNQCHQCTHCAFFPQLPYMTKKVFIVYLYGVSDRHTAVCDGYRLCLMRFLLSV